MDTLPTTPIATSSSAEPSEKYIRTFEGDMETLKKGGVPDLAPLRETQKVAVEQPATPAPAPTPILVPVPIPPPIPVPVPIPPPVAEPLPVAVPEVLKSMPLETYEGDFSNRMKETHASTATVLAAEQDSAPRVSQTPPEKFSRSSLLYSIAGGILIIAGSIGAYVAYVRYLSVSAPIILSPVVGAPIFVDEREQVSGAGPFLLQAIEQSVAHPIAQGAVRLLYFEGATTTTTSVFSALQEPAPGILLRNIVAAPSMTGVMNTGGVQSPFFILSVTSFGDTFAGMLAWEPVMPRDLVKLFPPYLVAIATSTVATTTSKSKAKIATTTLSVPAAVLAFRDEVIANHDVRVYRDAMGRSVLLYGYWNQTTLVIARDAAAFTEILGRLATSRVQ
jgi:hypothetical protein